MREPTMGILDTDFAKLTKGRTLGKKVIVPFKSAGFAQTFPRPAAVNILNVSSGDDTYALAMAVTLGPIAIVRGNIAAVNADSQSITGEQTNKQIQDAGDSVALGNAVALLEWGVGGVNYSAEIDFVNGTVINLTASYVRLGAKVYAMRSGNMPEVPYVLSAFIGPGNSKDRSAQFSQEVGMIGPATFSNVFATPAFAKSVIVNGKENFLTGGVGGWVGAIQFFRDPLMTFNVAEYLFSAVSNNSVNIPNGGYYWRTAGLATTADVSAVFDLSI